MGRGARQRAIMAVFVAGACALGGKVVQAGDACQDALTPAQVQAQQAAEQLTEAAFARALAGRGLELIKPTSRIVLTRAGDEPPRAAADEVAFEPARTVDFVRDRKGVVHLLLREPRVVRTTAVTRCGCDPLQIPGGAAPGKVTAYYKVGARRGDPVTVAYDVQDFSFLRACVEAPNGPPPP